MCAGIRALSLTLRRRGEANLGSPNVVTFMMPVLLSKMSTMAHGAARGPVPLAARHKKRWFWGGTLAPASEVHQPRGIPANPAREASASQKSGQSSQQAAWRRIKCRQGSWRDPSFGARWRRHRFGTSRSDAPAPPVAESGGVAAALKKLAHPSKGHDVACWALISVVPTEQYRFGIGSSRRPSPF
jgi:hypothetical protein